MTGLYQRSCAFGAHDDDKKYAAKASYANLMVGGVTTLVDVTFPYPAWVNVMGKSGPFWMALGRGKLWMGYWMDRLQLALPTCLVRLTDSQSNVFLGKRNEQASW